MPTHILQVNQLYRRFGDVQAVNGISFSVAAGTCFGLLGPNGAGKTTTIEILEGVKQADDGEVMFEGKPRTSEYAKMIGIQFQHTALQDFLTVRESLDLFAALYPNPRSVDELIQLCALEDFIDRDNRKLSGGQKQRLLLAIALINQPKLVFLDEPTTGLDPQARRHFWSLIRSIKAQGTTIILTTHYMDEAEQLCDEIAIVDRGEIIASGSPSQLLNAHFEGAIISLPDADDLQAVFADVTKTETGADYISSDVAGDLAKLQAKGISLDGLLVKHPNLEDLFLKLTGHSLRA
ncbi:MAG: ABC transporter ATP-binding protein [Gammaproteobacteria bacterium]|nr:ABC transporter ATP-binding protein [Gammaproteobacteria bacterium]